MIQPPLTERQQRIVALADSLAQQFAQHASEHDRQGEFPFAHYRSLHKEGYLRLAVPRHLGGEGASLFELVLAQEHLAQGDGATALAVDMTMHLMGRIQQMNSWPQPVFAAVCRSILDDGALLNMAASEPEMGSPSRGGLPATTATPAQGGWLINGHKTFVTMAPALRYFVVSVSLPALPEMPQGATASAIIPADTLGVRLEDTWSDGLSLRASGSYDLWLENVFVPDEWLVERQPAGTPIEPLAAAIHTAWFVLSFSAVYLGIGQAACNAACAFAHERVPTALGRSIATLSGIQRRVGEMHITLEAARVMLYQTAQAWDNQPDLRSTMTPHIAAVKYLCTNAAVRVTDLALRVAGGSGLTRKLPLERYFRDARAGLTHPPHDDAALEMVGRSVLDMAP
jgi:alkylation response protein AidB-like acyl-CoA dehydrogenase